MKRGLARQDKDRCYHCKAVGCTAPLSETRGCGRQSVSAGAFPLSMRVRGGGNIVSPASPQASIQSSLWSNQDLKQPGKWSPRDTEQSKLRVGVNVRTKREKASATD